MKGKNIILVAISIVLSFVLGCFFIIKKIIDNEEMRDSLKRIIGDKIERFLYGENLMVKDRSKVTYQNYYNYSKENRSVFDDFNNIVFDSYKEAKKTLDSMNHIIECYGTVTIADFYDVCDVASLTYKDTQYGWRNLSKCRVIRLTRGYKLDLPKPRKIVA